MSGVEDVVISFDYHQVLDVDRGLRSPERVGFPADDCHLLLRNIEAIAELRLRYPGLNIVVCISRRSAASFVRTTTLPEQ